MKTPRNSAWSRRAIEGRPGPDHGPSFAPCALKAKEKGASVPHQDGSAPQRVKDKKMRQAATQELYSYWNRLRGARLSPEREEIDPTAIRHILADTMILEADEARQLPIRIAGTRLNALFLDEQKGNPLVSLFAPEDRAGISAMAQAVLDSQRPAIAGLAAEAELGEDVPLELLMLPLRHRGKTHARLLASLTPQTLPSWFGLRAARRLRLIAIRFLDSDSAVPTSALLQRPVEPAKKPAALAAPRSKFRRFSFFVIPGGRDKPEAEL